MKILAIETSTILGGIAISDDSSGLIAEVRLNIKSTHSERLMTEIDHVLKQSGVMISDIDVFAVSIGPGSFTGLRIGLSTVKGFSYSTGKPIVSVPTLEALAWNFPYCRYPVCTMLDARKKEVYAALFRWEGDGFVRLIDEVSMKVDKFMEEIIVTHPPLIPPVKGEEHTPAPARQIWSDGPLSRGDSLSPLAGEGRCEGEISGEKIIFTGEGALLYKNKIIEVIGEKAVFASPEKMIPSPANVATFGMKRALKGEFSEPVSLVPFYIRRSEAEIKWND